MLISIGKLIAHLVTCLGLNYILGDEFGLTGVKFWIPYMLVSTLIYIINSLPR